MSFSWSSSEVQFLEQLEESCEQQNEQHWRKFGSPHPSFGEEEE